jgi:L-gulonolactone oxidase
MKGQKTLDLLNKCDNIVRDAGGAWYPAKDARMSSSDFKSSYPMLEEFQKYIDPKFSSSFWRRVMNLGE